MGGVNQLLYGPNVALALLGGAGVLATFLALFASAPSAQVGCKVAGEEWRRTTLQQMIEQANLPVTAGEFARTGAILAVATAVLGYVLLRTATGAILGALVGPLAYWGTLGGRRDKTRRTYQEALARVAMIVRGVVGRGGSMNEAITAVAQRRPRVVQGDFREAGAALASGQVLGNIRTAHHPTLDAMARTVEVSYVLLPWEEDKQNDKQREMLDLWPLPLLLCQSATYHLCPADIW